MTTHLCCGPRAQPQGRPPVSTSSWYRVKCGSGTDNYSFTMFCFQIDVIITALMTTCLYFNLCKWHASCLESCVTVSLKLFLVWRRAEFATRQIIVQSCWSLCTCCYYRVFRKYVETLLRWLGKSEVLHEQECQNMSFLRYYSHLEMLQKICKDGEACSIAAQTYNPNSVLRFLHTSLSFIFTHFRYKSIVSKRRRYRIP
jgi:hypothetical protein